IKNSYNDAKPRLIERFSFTDIQAQAILDMRLGRLAGMEREKVENELKEITELIEHLAEILGSEQMVLDIIKKEITEIRDKFSDERRTSIEPVVDDIDIEDLIAEEDNVITMTHQGYIKRLPVDTYKSQHRGGKGIVGMQTKEEDFVSTMFVSSTHSYIMLFTNTGRMFRIKAYRIPEASRQAKGTAIVNLLDLAPGETISALIPIREYTEGQYLTMCTKNGIIKKTDIMDYQNAPKGGKIAIKLDDDDELLRVKLTNGDTDLFIGTHKGKMIRFNEKDVRELGRVSRGVRAIKLEDDDYVVGMSVYRDGGKMLVVSENGFGKKTELEEYKTQSRGGKGCSTYKISPETGNVSGIKVVSPEDDIIIITSEGVIIRLDSEDISTYSRVTKGVRLMRLAEGVKVATIARVEKEQEFEEEVDSLESKGTVETSEPTETMESVEDTELSEATEPTDENI
ncbi:MAG: DNA gyrase C-terminal beta-propeller domain-containing protein, partial [Monoglobus pectinilyticus]